MKYEHLLEEGVEINKVWWEPDGELCVGRHGVKKITVSMVPGQGAMVPWLKVEAEGKPVAMHNGAFVAGLELA